MKKLKNSKGFTLMEMLIVVAIIAILVAIAIPTFTNQLEKAREATDMANLRSAYAEVMASALTGDTTNGVTDGSTSGLWTKHVDATQKSTGWTNPPDGGVTIGSVKNVTASTTGWTVTYNETNGTVAIGAD